MSVIRSGYDGSGWGSRLVGGLTFFYRGGMDIPEPFSPQPIDGGWCIAVVDEQRCIDVLSMLYNFRVVETLRSVNGGHSFYQRGWCYQGTGTVAFLRVLAALKAWDGSTNTEPQGWIKRTHPVTA